MSVGEFEFWFRSESRNVHLWGDSSVNQVVQAVESAFSEYYFADLDDSGLKQELANTVRPFEQASVGVSFLAKLENWMLNFC